MTPEQLDEIEKRWAGYLEKDEVERRFLFDRWWDKRDFWDMTKALREAWEALDEREGDMHARIRAGYDKTVADSWRAHCAKVEKERDEARAEVDRLREVAKHSFTLDQITATMKQAIDECANNSTPMPRRQRRVKKIERQD